MYRQSSFVRKQKKRYKVGIKNKKTVCFLMSHTKHKIDKRDTLYFILPNSVNKLNEL